MKTLTSSVRRFLVSEDGPTAVEYALMVALIAVAAVTAISALGTQLTTTFGDIKGKIAGSST